MTGLCHLMKFWYLSHILRAKAQVSLHKYQSVQSLHCWHALSKEVDEGIGKILGL